MCVRTFVRMHTRVRAYVCMYVMYMCIYICMFILGKFASCRHAREYACTCLCICVYMYIYIPREFASCCHARVYVCKHAYTQVCVYIYLYIYEYLENLHHVAFVTAFRTCPFEFRAQLVINSQKSGRYSMYYSTLCNAQLYICVCMYTYIRLLLNAQHTITTSLLNVLQHATQCTAIPICMYVYIHTLASQCTAYNYYLATKHNTELFKCTAYNASRP